jgi:hypothetical protein
MTEPIGVAPLHDTPTTLDLKNPGQRLGARE